jgi:hypothetical protein
MTQTIELPIEVYEKLEQQAQARGLTVADVIARLIEEVEASHRQAVFEQMRAEGLLLPKKSLPPDQERIYKRIDVQGKPVSECLIEERR